MKIVELEFGSFQFFPDVILGEINEGVHYDKTLNEILKSVAIKHYGTDHKVGYISLRNNKYSVDPMVHHENRDFRQLTSIAIVNSRNSSQESIAIEAKFFRKNKLKSFYTAEEALVWVSSQN